MHLSLIRRILLAAVIAVGLSPTPAQAACDATYDASGSFLVLTGGPRTMLTDNWDEAYNYMVKYCGY